MPWSQMISMNISPPRLSEARKLAVLPAAKARMRNRLRRNIGCSTRVSMTPKTTSRQRPPTMAASTLGLVHPMAWWP